jgi:hypothetical protein
VDPSPLSTTEGQYEYLFWPANPKTYSGELAVYTKVESILEAGSLPPDGILEHETKAKAANEINKKTRFI